MGTGRLRFAALAAALFAVWTSGLTIWDSTHPIEIDASSLEATYDDLDDAELDDAELYDDLDDEELYDDLDDEADRDEPVSDQEDERDEVEPDSIAPVDVPGETGVDIGSLRRSIEARRARDAEELAEELAEDEEDEEDEEEEEEAEEPEEEDEGGVSAGDDDAAMPPLELTTLAWATWGIGVALALLLAAALARHAREDGRFGLAAACFAALAIAQIVSMVGWITGSVSFWLLDVLVALLAAGSVIGTWAASGPKRAPLVVLAVVIGVQLFLAPFESLRVAFATITIHLPLVLAFTLARGTLPTGAPTDAAGRARVALAIATTFVAGVAVLILALWALALRRGMADDVPGLAWSFGVVLHFGAAAAMTWLAFRLPPSRATTVWHASATALWASALTGALLVWRLRELQFFEQRWHVHVGALVLVATTGAWAMTLTRAIRMENAEDVSSRPRPARAVAALAIGWLVAERAVLASFTSSVAELMLTVAAMVVAAVWLALERAELVALAEASSSQPAPARQGSARSSRRATPPSSGTRRR